MAITGSGLAGLAAAAQLKLRGHDVVVFERDEAPGGLMRFGAPDFKLDKLVIDWRELDGVHVAMTYLYGRNRWVAARHGLRRQLVATGPRSLRASRERRADAPSQSKQELIVGRLSCARQASGARARLGVASSRGNPLRSPWVAVDLAGDTVTQARLLRRAHEVVLSGRGTPPVLRDVIIRSWERCASAGVDPDRPAPMLLDTEKAAARFAEHPLSAVSPIVRGLLDSVSVEARHLVAISDADGVLLWSEGHPRVVEAARAPHFVPGAQWSEAGVGTNAIGTAIVLDHSLQVFSAEHFKRLLHGWAGAAAPVHDPESGAILGVIGLSGSFRTAHPHTLALVSAVARAAELQLARERRSRDAELVARYLDRLPAAGRRPSALVADDGRVVAATPRGWLGPCVSLDAGEGRTILADGTPALVEPAPDGASIVWAMHARERRAPRHVLFIRALAAARASLRLAGRSLPLSERQAELLTVLALHPAGLSARSLARCLYHGAANPVTVRAEIARVRHVVGDLVDAQPYRLTAEIRADFLDVETLLERGRVEAALDRYTGPLLPRSRAPCIVTRRAALDAAVSRARCNPLQPPRAAPKPARAL